MREGRRGRSADPSESAGWNRLASAAPCAFQSTGLPEVSFCVSAGPLSPPTMSIQHRALLLEGDKPVSGDLRAPAYTRRASAPHRGHLTCIDAQKLPPKIQNKILSW